MCFKFQIIINNHSIKVQYFESQLAFQKLFFLPAKLLLLYPHPSSLDLLLTQDLIWDEGIDIALYLCFIIYSYLFIAIYLSFALDFRNSIDLLSSKA